MKLNLLRENNSEVRNRDPQLSGHSRKLNYFFFRFSLPSHEYVFFFSIPSQKTFPGCSPVTVFIYSLVRNYLKSSISSVTETDTIKICLLLMPWIWLRTGVQERCMVNQSNHCRFFINNLVLGCHSFPVFNSCCTLFEWVLFLRFNKQPLTIMP